MILVAIVDAVSVVGIETSSTSADSFELAHRLVERMCDLVGRPGGELLDNANAHPLGIALKRRGVVRHRLPARGRIIRVMARDYLEHQRGVAHAPCDRSRMVERVAQR